LLEDAFIHEALLFLNLQKRQLIALSEKGANRKIRNKANTALKRIK
jgi:hypothetical protein